MKIIELLTEQEKEDWATLQGYDVTPIQKQFSDKKDTLAFFRGEFTEELKKIVGFLSAWERRAFKYGHTLQSAKDARRNIVSILAAIENNGAETLNEIHGDNVKIIREKLKKAALYFGSLSHDFQDAGESDLSRISVKIHDLLHNASEEVISVSSTKFKRGKDAMKRKGVA